MATPYVTTTGAGIDLKVRVIPRSSKNQVGGVRQDALVVKLTAPPVDGKANHALLKFLAKRLGIAPSLLSIEKGASARDKLVQISAEAGMTEGDVISRLRPAS
jgi:hypothetical protein